MASLGCSPSQQNTWNMSAKMAEVPFERTYSCFNLTLVRSGAEGPAEPAERGHPVPEGESARGAAALPAAVGRPRDGGDPAAQPDPTAAAEPG